jgi:hypothetical protein
MEPNGAGTYPYRASADDEVVSRAGKLLLDWVGPGIPVPVPAMHHLIQAAVIIANTSTALPDGVAVQDWTAPLLTTSKAAPETDLSWLRSSSFQPESVAPDRNQFDPLSATNIP